MGMKVILDWYDKTTEIAEGKEYSVDFGDDISIIEVLGLTDEGKIYDGGFDVKGAWIQKLQPLFNHKIAPATYDYQISFRYRKTW